MGGEVSASYGQFQKIYRSWERIARDLVSPFHAVTIFIVVAVKSFDFSTSSQYGPHIGERNREKRGMHACMHARVYRLDHEIEHFHACDPCRGPRVYVLIR